MAKISFDQRDPVPHSEWVRLMTAVIGLASTLITVLH